MIKPKEIEKLAKTFTCNQTGAIACLLASALWGLAATGVNIMTGILPAFANTAYSILVIIGWILIPLYIKLIKPAFIVGIIVSIISLIGIAVSPTTTPWFAFTEPIYDFSFVAFYLIMLAGIYYSYKTYKELK